MGALGVNPGNQLFAWDQDGEAEDQNRKKKKSVILRVENHVQSLDAFCTRDPPLPEVGWLTNLTSFLKELGKGGMRSVHPRGFPALGQPSPALAEQRATGGASVGGEKLRVPWAGPA